MAHQPETVPFAHGAAGHQGISTSTDGSLLIKPCTQAEIDFYESAKDHPEFQAHMPVYMGSLTLGNAEVQKQASMLQSQQGGNDFLQPSNGPMATGQSRGHSRTASGHITSEPLIKRSATTEWTPSGGAKLTSNLSIVLSNATAGFQKPNVIDLKLGARLWDNDAPVAKRVKLDEVANTSTSGSLGFRIAGMKVYVGDTQDSNMQREVNTHAEDGYKTYDKFYGRNNITDANIRSAFDAFLYSLQLHPRRAAQDAEAHRKALLRRLLLVERLLREVSSIQYVLENEESRMYSASILMVYEGDPDALDAVIKYRKVDDRAVVAEAIEPDDTGTEEADDDEDEDDEGVKQKIHEVVMIDFAHAHWTPGQGPDENVLQGVRSIRGILETILQEVQKEIEM